MSSGGYRAVLRAPGVAFLLTTSLIARLPVAMANLAIILRIAAATGSYARAGGVTGAYVVGTGIMGPVLGRMADRVGRRPVLLLAALANAAGLIALAFISMHATLLVLIVAAVSGASLPPVAPAVRSLWPVLVRGDLRSSLYAFDATMQEATFMVGPTLVALLSTLSGPPAALIACGGIGLVGTLALSLHPAISSPRADPMTEDRPAGEATATGGGAAVGDLATVQALEPAGDDPVVPLRRRFQPAGIPGLGTMVVVVFVFLAAIVVVEVTVVAFAGRAHASNQAGILLAVWSSGSMAGGFAFGARTAHAGTRVLAPVLAAAGLGFLCLAAAPGVGVLYLLLFVAGVSIAPGFSCIYGLVGSLAPSTGSVEAFSWVASGIQMGAAGGAALGGLLVDTIGTRGSFVLAAGGAAATAVIALRRTRRLRPARGA
ncbi:MAG TPA: MFS transporter [Acidimicrobiales bacterium]|nr:MFS transporter [Acidimicrobiales bacterium]